MVINNITFLKLSHLINSEALFVSYTDLDECINVYCFLPLTVITILILCNYGNDTVRAMKTYRGNESVVPLIRILDTRQRIVAKFTPLPLCLGGKNPDNH